MTKSLPTWKDPPDPDRLQRMPLSPHMLNPVYRLDERSISKAVKICTKMGLEDSGYSFDFLREIENE